MTRCRACNCKEINRLVAELVRQGWVLSQNKHPRVTAPGGQFVTFSLTPSDGNAHRQFERDVRRVQLNQQRSTCHG